ncbi:hypothetical protein ABW19_dt0207203 [Dactylella cylindrospora]|nr:hypothetical protein ABW19_dt0207203 [Dactylella cylindrospora]
MDHDEYADEAIFDDLYDDEPPKSATTASKILPQTEQKPAAPVQPIESSAISTVQTDYTPAEPQQSYQQGNTDYSGYNMNQDYSQNQEMGFGNGNSNNWGQDQQSHNNGYGQGFFGDGSGLDSQGGSTAIKEDG